VGRAGRGGSGRGGGGGLEGSPALPAPARFGLALALLAVAARAVVVVGQATVADRHAWATFWAVPALWGQDLALVAVLTSAAALAAWSSREFARRWRIGRALAWAGRIGYAAVALWIAINVPVALVLSSPVTAGLLHATGGALGASFRAYLTPVNLGAPLALLVLAWSAPRAQVLRRWRAGRGLSVLAVVLVALAALGPLARTRVDTRGLHRNAVVALVETAWRRQQAGAALQGFALPACAPTDTTAGRDLRAFAGAAAGRNIVWVILESTGARHLPFLAAAPAPGDAAAVAPHLTALAQDALVFDRAYAAYPESIKGLFSMLCSRTPPPDSEASDYVAGRLPCTPIADRLRAAGYRTGLFHSGRFAYLGMAAVVGDRGFDTLADAAVIPSRFTSSFGVDDAATADALLRFVDRAPEQRFFAVFMPIAGHHPYHAPGSGVRPFAETSLAAEHRNDVFVADQAFGRLRAGLAARGLDERTLYVVVGDHGEAFREHAGNVAHALYLYEENVHVPFFAAAPGLWHGRQHAPQAVSLLDLAPTTLALASVAASDVIEGRSALDPRPRVVRFFTEQAVRRAGLLDGERKLLIDEDAGRAQLFDLAHDPDERRDLAADATAWIAERRSCLQIAPAPRALAAR
jgi:phosphoglycerol transferase MdoB-like AlkP superfamily enzyme